MKQKLLAGLSAYRFFLSRMMESFKGWDTGIRITSVDGPGVRTMKIVSHGNIRNRALGNSSKIVFTDLRNMFEGVECRHKPIARES